MKETIVQGSHYEIGQQYASKLKEFEFTPPPASDEKLAFADESEPYAEEFIPELLDELTGLAEGGDWEFDLIKAVPLALTIESGCSVVAISGERTTDGRPIFGRNYDFYRSFAPYSELFETNPTNHYSSVGCSDHWTGRHDGINEEGLAIGHTFVPNYGGQPGIMFALAARAVLDNCGLVVEAVDFLERIPHARNTNFVVADATGDIALIEASPEMVKTTRPDDGFVAATNHFLSEEMKEYEDSSDIGDHSLRRLTNIEEWKDSSESFSLDSLQTLLVSPTEGTCTCGSENASNPVETLWSWAAKLDHPPETLLSRGRPDNHPYEVVK